MELQKCLLTKNDCYKKATEIIPKGIVVHSTGANNPNLKRYVQPDDGLLGVNKNNNSWNRSGLSVCVHGFIGKDKNGDVQIYQTLPFDYACWGVGKGKKGSYNYNPTGYIQFEICEDSLKDETYFNEAFDLAAQFCAYLCKEYNIPLKDVVSHHEAYERGYGSNHSDCDHWLKKFGKDMDWFRNEVNSYLNPKEEPKKEEPKGTPVNYLVTINTKELNVREEPSADSQINTTVKQGEVYTIVAELNGWGKLKSGAGWISLNYTIKKGKETSKTKKVNYKVKIVKTDSLRVRDGAGTNFKVNTYVKRNEVYTIVEEKNDWGKLKSGAGWISLNYTKKIK